ncbi:putative mitochondrial carrier protein [Medicago truncatula]|uniref:ADP/ATP translocase n=1 Tax=Medicago truncatula TaxID=3880 RepID=A0A396HKN1_MEDTR|nr:putative mitochondrial carrier protein [Medicago truncatula]
MAASSESILDHIPLFAKELLAGGLAGGFAKTVVAPLERLKILFQVVSPTKLNVSGMVNNEQVYRGIRDCLSKTYKEGGIKGIYRGVELLC